MPYPHLRPDERSGTPSATRTVGVVVLTEGRRYFFAGGTEALALIMADNVLGTERMKYPDTRVEFGEARDGVWIPEKVLKAGREV